MHVSILAGLPVTSSAYSEHKARAAAPFHQLVRVGVVGAALVVRLKGLSAPAERLKRLSSRLAECNRPWVRAVHSTFLWALTCHAEAGREPSRSVSSFSRKS